MIDPQRFYPGVADVARVGRAGHVRANGLPCPLAACVCLDGAAIAAGQKLPLFQREVRQLIDADEQKLRALVLVHVVFVAAIAEARCRAVLPRDDMLRFVVLAIVRLRYVAPEIS